MQHVKCWSHASWAEIKDLRKFLYAQKSLFLSHFVQAFFLHPCLWAFLLCHDNPSTWQMWHIKLYEVHFVLGTIKGRSKMCSFVTQHNATDVSSFEGVCNWHAGCRNVHQSCLDSMSNWPLKRRTRVTTPAQDLHIRLLYLGDCLRRGGVGVLRSISVCKKSFCGEKLILIGWAWLSSGWAYALRCPPMAAQLHVKSID